MKLFETQIFESLEINPSKKIFKINGEDFGKYCDKYDIEIHLENDESIVIFRRHDATKFIIKYDAPTNRKKIHIKKENNYLFYEKIKESLKSFSYEEIDFYPMADAGIFLYVLNAGYDAIVVDFGVA